ncbi:GNAT family N-acetyltransferase [Paracoccus thiocyanatus]|uniref:N-acetyltransferase n=1 Tax=Paracoccus thiocyanatus TaxID=34006 RepID=A0A3D8PFH8_9RHOB|nr:GNAT family N-acetyltransferase [Paracoccus thiocyanatus]RDW13979.1 N-acetyltransferase [Paracoccus thiocyanatus]
MIRLADTPVLTTERLVLRAPQAGDWPAWRDFFESDRAGFVGGPMVQPGQSWRAFGHFIGHWVLRGYGMFVLTERGSDLGLGAVGPWFPDGWPEHEIGWTLWSGALEGRGYAQEAALAARDFALRTLGWSRPVSYIDPANVRSIALARRLGAVHDPQAEAPHFGDDRSPPHVFRHPLAGAA